MDGQPTSEKCTWCGASVDSDDGFRAYEAAGERRAVFCRLEHVVPWAMQGPHWEPGQVTEPPGIVHPAAPDNVFCSRCGSELGDVQVLLVRHRGEHRVADYFCSTEHMAEWAKAGGRWQ